MQTIHLCVYISSCLSQRRPCPSKVATNWGLNIYLLRSRFVGETLRQRFYMAHMGFWAASGETTTEANKTAHKAFCNLAISLINIKQQFIIINPCCFTLSAFLLLAHVAQFIQTCIKHTCSTKSCIVPILQLLFPPPPPMQLLLDSQMKLCLLWILFTQVPHFDSNELNLLCDRGRKEWLTAVSSFWKWHLTKQLERTCLYNYLTYMWYVK